MLNSTVWRTSQTMATGTMALLGTVTAFAQISVDGQIFSSPTNIISWSIDPTTGNAVIQTTIGQIIQVPQSQWTTLSGPGVTTNVGSIYLSPQTLLANPGVFVIGVTGLSSLGFVAAAVGMVSLPQILSNDDPIIPIDNQNPEFTSGNSAVVDENYISTGYIAEATDPDNDTITYSLSGGPDQVLFSLDSVSGVLNFLSAPNYESPQDQGANNTYKVEITAKDGNGGSATQLVTINVADVNEIVNSVPIFTSGTSATVNENQTATGYAAAATDADGDAVTYSISGGADAAHFRIDPTAGLLSFINAPDFEVPSDQNLDGMFEIEITAVDTNAGATSQIVNLSVDDIFDKVVSLLGPVSQQANEPRDFLKYNGKLYFSSNWKIWEYDPSNPNNEPTEFYGGVPPVNLSAHRGLFSIGDEFYFAAFNNNQTELWKFNTSDPNGTAERISALSLGNGTEEILEHEGKLYFPADNGLGSGVELWVYDTNSPILGAQLFADLNPGVDSSLPGEILIIGSKLYFTGYGNDGFGKELRSINLDTKQIEVEYDLRPGIESSAISNLVYIEDKLYFGGRDATSDHELWMYDPSVTSAVPQLIEDLSPAGNGFSGPIVKIDNVIYFKGTTSHSDWELYKYDLDNPNNGINLAAEFSSISGGLPGGAGQGTDMIAVGDKIYLSSFGESGNPGLYSFDSSNPNVVPVNETKEFDGIIPSELFYDGDAFYFSSSYSFKDGLWTFT